MPPLAVGDVLGVAWLGGRTGVLTRIPHAGVETAIGSMRPCWDWREQSALAARLDSEKTGLARGALDNALQPTQGSEHFQANPSVSQGGQRLARQQLVRHLQGRRL